MPMLANRDITGRLQGDNRDITGAKPCFVPVRFL